MDFPKATKMEKNTLNHKGIFLKIYTTNQIDTNEKICKSNIMSPLGPCQGPLAPDRGPLTALQGARSGRPEVAVPFPRMMRVRSTIYSEDRLSVCQIRDQSLGSNSRYVCKPGSVLYFTVLYCTILFCTVLYCTVLKCTLLHCTTLSNLRIFHAILTLKRGSHQL